MSFVSAGTIASPISLEVREPREDKCRETRQATSKTNLNG